MNKSVKTISCFLYINIKEGKILIVFQFWCELDVCTLSIHVGDKKREMYFLFKQDKYIINISPLT